MTQPTDEELFEEFRGRDLFIWEARHGFEGSMDDANWLLDAHRAVGQVPDGEWYGDSMESLLATHGRQRDAQMAINRAIVVFTVAAWQAYVEELTEAILRAMPVDPDQAARFIDAFTATIREAVHRFATPSAESTQTLLRRVGFDPWPAWNWREGRTTVDPSFARKRINEWVKVRHAIAHGGGLPDVAVVKRKSQDGYTVTHRQAKSCTRFFMKLVFVTHDAAAHEFAYHDLYDQS